MALWKLGKEGHLLTKAGSIRRKDSCNTGVLGASCFLALHFTSFLGPRDVFSRSSWSSSVPGDQT